MTADFAGILTIVFVLLLSKRLGWNADPARELLLGSALLFAVGIVLPVFGLEARGNTWILLATFATALGAIALVLAVLRLTRVAPAAEKTEAPRVPETHEPPPPRTPEPEDPFAGPHDDRA